MARMGLRVDFEVVTPLFLGGAEQIASELRPPAFKGLLRFWYRAVDPGFMKNEPALFGGTGGGAGQSGLLLRIDSDTPKSRPLWKDFKADRFSQGRGTGTRNGLIYLGFPFQMRDGERQAIPHGHRFTLRCLLPRISDPVSDYARRLQRAVLASCWLLGHFGGAGSRARRGFGGLSLIHWEPEEGEWLDLERLPLLSQAAGAQDARARLAQAVDLLRDWFGSWDKDDTPTEHPHLGARYRHKLLDSAVPKGDWDRGLADMGAALQNFRVRRGPDYQAVKDLVAENRPFYKAPERTSFGLPLTFRYSSVRGRPVTLVPYNAEERSTDERQGSLLFLRLTAVGANLHPFYLRLDGAVPGQNPPAGIRGQGRPLLPADGNAMDAFFDSLPAAGGQ